MLLNSKHIAIILLEAISPATSIQLWSSYTAIPSDVPLACRAALVLDIDCLNSLVRPQDIANGAVLTKDAAQLYCTSTCQESIQDYVHGVRSACGDKDYILNHDTTARQFPIALASGLSWAYNVSCIEDSTGFCLADLYNNEKTACSECMLRFGAAMLSSDYGRSQFAPAEYSSLLSSCSIAPTSYPIDYTPLPTPTSTTSSDVPTATPTTCKGTTYVVQEADTCESISLENSVATDRLIQLNHLDYHCSSLTTGSELCIDEMCTVFTVSANDTCQGIYQGQSFGLVQLLGWNPTIHEDCDNLDSMVGRTLCVSPPGGGDFALPAPSNISSPTLTSSLISDWVPGKIITMPPNITTSWYTPPIDHDFSPPVITHTANETAESLYDERTVFCWISDEDMLDEEFVAWNMEDDCLTLFERYCQPRMTDPMPTSTIIPGSCTPTFTSDTLTTSSSQATVPTPTPTQPNMISGCTEFHQVQDGDQCDAIAADYGISLDEFYAWNPDVGTTCGSLWIEYYVCVGVSSSSSTSTTTGTTTTTTTTTSTSTEAATPTPTQPNMVDGCTEFHQVATGDQCGSIADEYGISLDNLYAWNPDIGTDCKALWLDYYVCVARGPTQTSTSRTTTKSTTTTTTSGVATPTPTQAGMITTCRRFHLVQSGDKCGTIASENNISLSDFYRWNPGVGSSCGSLWLDYYVCVGVA